jgi:hypothetical protein
MEYEEATIVRKVSTNKQSFSFKGRDWTISRAFQSERIAIRPHNADGTYGVYFGSILIKTIALAT